MAYSKDLRERIVNAVLSGETIQKMEQLFNIHHNTISNWMTAYYEEGRVSSKPYHRQKPYKADWKAVVRYVKGNPELTQCQYAEEFNISQSQVCKILQYYGITHKKKELTYQEQDASKVKTFIDKFEAIEDKDKIVYLDESSVNHKLINQYGYAERGQKLVGKIAGKRLKKDNVIAGLCHKEIVAPCTYKENMNKERFNVYMKNVLIPSLTSGSTIILDNAPFHKLHDETKELLNIKNCKVLYLPPYSPELNKIENYWAIMKKHIRRCRRNFSTIRDTMDFVFQNIFNSVLTNL